MECTNLWSLLDQPESRAYSSGPGYWHLPDTSSNLPNMAKENSFDIASKVDLEEVTNAVHQAMKEVRQRFDFKGSKSEVQLEEDELVLTSDDEYKLQSLTEILQQ